MTVLINLAELDLHHGDVKIDSHTVDVAPYRQAGQEYVIGNGSVVAELRIAPMLKGWELGLSFESVASGPCARCLEHARVPISVATHEYVDRDGAGDPDVEPEDDEEALVSEFVGDDNVLDVTAWVQSSVGEVFPQRALCTADCRGLCPSCGTNWNEASCDCTEDTSDPRWDQLAGLKIDDPGSDADDADAPADDADDPAHSDDEDTGRALEEEE